MKKLILLFGIIASSFASNYHVKKDLVSYSKHSDKLKDMNLLEGFDNKGRGISIFKRYNKYYSYGLSHYKMERNSYEAPTEYWGTVHELEYKINDTIAINTTGYIGYQEGYCGGINLHRCKEGEKNSGLAVGATIGLRFGEYFYMDGMVTPKVSVAKFGLRKEF